ncbi:MAG: hypothetical protein K8F24_03630, partial [Bacteroidales bacterium]|nr:hypothetical protein [Bacteroidales bacterium]
MKKQLLFIMALMFAGASVWAQNTWEVPGDYATIQAAITAATAGDVIEVSGEHVLTTNISLTKRLTIDGLNVGVIKGDNTLPSISGGRYFMHISGAGAQSVIKNLTFVKTDKAGPQNIIGLQANDVTFDNCDFTGAYVLGDPDVSRAFEVAYNTTGILIQNCSFIALRQPAYFNPGSQGQVLNNYIEGTRGWVLIGQPTPLTEIVFNGNSWLNNAVDIYLDPTIHFGAPYDPISTLISYNNGATMLDNRATYPVLNVTKSIAYTGIQLAINAADPNDVIEVAAGTYAEDIVVDKALDIRGPNYGISPNTAIRGDEAIIHPATSSPNGEVIKVQASDVTINGFTIDGDNPS